MSRAWPGPKGPQESKVRPDGQVNGQQARARARLGQKEVTWCPCLHILGTQEADWPCPKPVKP